VPDRAGGVLLPLRRMPLIYVTGPTAAGKSTLRAALADRGYEAHDVDTNGMRVWRDRKTGDVVEYPADPRKRTRTWLSDHVVVLSEARVRQLAERAKDRFVFLCGTAPNDLDDFAALFERVICVEIDEPTMRARIATRTNNRFGKAPDELAVVVRNREPLIDFYRRRGAVMIDGAQPLDVVIEEVLRHADADATALRRGTVEVRSRVSRT
jgi:adenylate kinase family enzyme